MAKEKRNQSNGDGREKLELKKLRELLAEQQLLLKEHRLPVLILLEGWSGAGKIGRCRHQSLQPAWILF